MEGIKQSNRMAEKEPLDRQHQNNHRTEVRVSVMAAA
jgi:hypothetical protein